MQRKKKRNIQKDMKTNMQSNKREGYAEEQTKDLQRNKKGIC